MREALKTVHFQLVEASEASAALRERYGDPTGLSRLRRKEYDEASAELARTQRHLSNELKLSRAKFTQRREDVLDRTSAELIKLVEAYDKTYSDLSSSPDEAAALSKLTGLCVPFSLEALEEREETRPMQPGDLGPSHLVRTLLRLAESADQCGAPGGPLDRLAGRAAKAGGVGCSHELTYCKGFRRAMEKAHHDYDGAHSLLPPPRLPRLLTVAPPLSDRASAHLPSLTVPPPTSPL